MSARHRICRLHVAQKGGLRETLRTSLLLPVAWLPDSSTSTYLSTSDIYLGLATENRPNPIICTQSIAGEEQLRKKVSKGCEKPSATGKAGITRAWVGMLECAPSLMSKKIAVESILYPKSNNVNGRG